MCANRGVLCFSRGWHNPLLWSHYGDKHRGVCLGFDVPNAHIVHVSYNSSRLLAAASKLLGGGPEFLGLGHTAALLGWLLAEMGAIGLVVFAAPIIRILFAELKPGRRTTPPAQILILIIVAFSVTSLVHEILYQRLFWLVFGAAMAVTKWAEPIPDNVPTDRST